MRILYKNKLLLAISVCATFFIAGCVDTSVQPIPNSIDYSSLVKFVNLVSGASTATIQVNNQTIGPINLGEETSGSFMSMPSGSKIVTASFTADTFRISLQTERKSRIFLWGNQTTNGVASIDQRYTWQTPGSANAGDLFLPDHGQVTFFNGSLDAVLSSVTLYGADTLTWDFALESGESNGEYLEMESGTYTFDFVYNETDTLPVGAYTFADMGRYTAVMYGDTATGGSGINTAFFVDD